MTVLEKKVDLLAQILLASNHHDKTKAKEELRLILAGKGDPTPGCIEDEAESLLMEIGVPFNLRGFHDLKLAICMVAKDPDYRGKFVYCLYPEIAQKVGRGSTGPRVERGIRHAIEVAWDRGDAIVLSKYFGNTIDSVKGRPTNSEFIIRMAEEVSKRASM